MVSDVFSIPYEGTANEATDQALPEFVAGPENALLKSVSDAISGLRYNPILLYGTTAVGKTHLLSLFAASYSFHHPSCTVLSLNGTEFARGYATAVELNATDEFRKKHRQSDLFVLDDLQELAGRAGAQQELLHTMDAIVDSQSQILIGSRTCLADSDWMLTGLASRLSSGLAVPIRKPESATRRVLLARIAKDQGVRLTERVANEILHNRCTETVSQLTSAVWELSNSTEKPLDQATARQILNRRNNRSTLPPRQIIKQVARCFQIKSAELVGESRRQSTVRARGVAVYLIRQLTGISFEQLGRNFGGRDHSTMLHAYRRTKASLQSDPIIHRTIHEITQRLGVNDVY